MEATVTSPSTDAAPHATPWQEEFAQEPGLIYLNHAAVAPWPRRAQLAVTAFAEENLKWGATHYPQWIATESRLRQQLAALINAPSPSDIALVKNTSEGLSMIAHGLPWQRGDNVVISDEEFPSNRIVWESLAKQGVQLRQVSLQGLNPEADLIAATDGHTRVLSVSAVQYASGRRLHLESLGQACAQRNVRFCVDAIQSLGALRFDAQAIGADYVVADGHKWLLGPEGLALFYCRAERREELTLREYGWHMVEQAHDFDATRWEVAHSARRFECGSPNMLGIYALSAAVSLLQEVGMTVIEHRVLNNSACLLEALQRDRAVEILTPTATERHAGIVTFRVANADPGAIVARLRARDILCAHRGGGVRFSPHFYNTETQLHEAVRCLRGA
jgi:selenocysteine lyase/cysteine desulfurase